LTRHVSLHCPFCFLCLFVDVGCNSLAYLPQAAVRISDKHRQSRLKCFVVFLLLFLLLLLLLLLLLIRRYNLYKVLACSTTFFQLSLFCATFFHLRTFMLFISSKTSSSQRILGLPVGLLDKGFHLLVFCTVLSSAMRSTWFSLVQANARMLPQLHHYLSHPVLPKYGASSPNRSAL